MARRPKGGPLPKDSQPKDSQPKLPAPTKSNREKIVETFMALLAEQPFEKIGFGDISARCRLSLADCRAEFGSTLAVLAAHIKELDRKVLAGGEADMAEEPPRERLFDILMRRLEILAPHRAAMRSLMRSAGRNPGLALALNSLALRSQQWMLTAAGIDAAGPRGMVRAQGLALLYGRVMQVWLNDDDPGLARTLAALDRELARGQRWFGVLNNLCRFAPRWGGLRRRRRGDGRSFRDEEPIMA
jgi:AcrR family transcriptional regulator